MSAKMYIRFITPGRVEEARYAAPGIFQGGGGARHDMRLPEWLRSALKDEYAWFNDHLDAPERFGLRMRGDRKAYAGLCWFRDDAREALRHAYTLASLLGEAGVPVTRVVSNRPGDIVWRDHQQIVAMPHRDSPVLWQ